MGRIGRILAVLALIAAPLAAAAPAHAAAAHPAKAQVISCAGRYYKFTMVYFDTGTIEYNGGYAYQEPNYFSPMCQVDFGWGFGQYAWVIYGTNLCLTYSATLGYNHYIACDPNIAAQEWHLYIGDGWPVPQYFVINNYRHFALKSQGNYLPTYAGPYNNYDGTEVWILTLA